MDVILKTMHQRNLRRRLNQIVSNARSGKACMPLTLLRHIDLL